MYDILRCVPAIETIAKGALGGNLDDKAFPYLDDAREAKEKGVAKWHQDRNEDEGRVIIAILGGITHYEICSLQNLDRAAGTQRLVIGSTQVVNARDYVNTMVAECYPDEVKKGSKKKLLT